MKKMAVLSIATIMFVLFFGDYVGMHIAIVSGAVYCVPEDFSNVQRAIDNCQNGDIIIVGCVDYKDVGNRNINYGDKNVTVLSVGSDNFCRVAENYGSANSKIICEESTDNVIEPCITAAGTDQVTYYVNATTGNDENSGLSPDKALATVQKGISLSHEGDVVLVYPGVYLGDINFMSKTITLTSTEPENPSVVGTTVLSPKKYFIECSDGTIEGFTINGGIYFGNNNYPADRSYAPKVRHCHIDANSLAIGGFVGYMQAAPTPIFENNIIEGQSGLYFFVQAVGKGMNPIIRNNTIIGKNPAEYGSGIEYRTSRELPVVSNNIIVNFKYGIEVTYHNSLENQRKSLIQHNDVFGNVYNYCFGDEERFDMTGIQGNICENPKFADWNSRDYYLKPDSPCIDAGEDAEVYEDIEGNIRPFDFPGVDNNGDLPDFDIGAYEIINIPPVANAGPDQTVYADPNGTAEVTLDGSASFDDDNDPLTYLWKWTIDGNDFTSTEPNFTIELPAGQHTFELIVNDGLDDSEPNDVNITVVPPLKSRLEVMPNVINRAGNQPRIMGMLSLAGIAKNKVDLSKPILLYPGGIKSVRTELMQYNVRGVPHTMIFVRFDKDELMSAVGNGKVKLRVVGKLKTGRYFYGDDSVTVMGHRWPFWR